MARARRQEKNDFAESDMFAPLRDHMAAQGFAVNAEVEGCDLVATQGDRVVVVEMKKAFGLPLIYQALDRLALTEWVYMAIPRPARTGGAAYRRTADLVKRLKLGLMTVAMDSPLRTVEVWTHPEDAARRARADRREALLREIEGRTLDDNVGGTRGVKRMTAYRERCIRVACALERSGPTTTARLIREAECPEETYTILRGNPYGWFERTAEKGVYALTASGRTALSEATGAAGALVAHYRAATPAMEAAPKEKSRRRPLRAQCDDTR